MSIKKYKLLYFISAACFVLLAVAVALFYPASYLELNKGTSVLYAITTPLFWLGLLGGLVLQIYVRFCIGHAVRKSAKQKNGETKFLNIMFKTKLSIILLALGVIGIIGTVICLTISIYSTWKVFALMALAVLGISEYLVFNSKYFLYFIKRSDKSVKQ